MTRMLEHMINDQSPSGTDDLVATLCAAMLPEVAGTAPDWITIPYRDVPYDRDGVRGIQRLNQVVAAQLVANWQAVMAADPRGAAGSPFYVGHPDYLANPAVQATWLRDQPPACGWIRAMRATPNALELRVEWTDEGARLVCGRIYRFFSPYFLSEPLASEGGVNVYAPRTIKSAGLTNTPNWPMPPMVNAANPPGGHEDGQTMTLLQRLIAILGDEALTTDDDVVTAIQKMISAIKALRESIDARWDAEDAARQALPNADDTFALATGCIAHLGGLTETLNAATDRATGLEVQLGTLRTDFAQHLVDAAVARGAVLQTHAPSRVQDLVNAGDAFQTKAKELASLPRLMKTDPVVTGAADRNAGVLDRRQQILDLVHAAMDKGQDYDTSFARVRKDHPALFGTTSPDAA